jgi:hypothetical protein
VVAAVSLTRRLLLVARLLIRVRRHVLVTSLMVGTRRRLMVRQRLPLVASIRVRCFLVAL